MRTLCKVAIAGIFTLCAAMHISARETTATCDRAACCQASQRCDSVEIPVYLVDGVEVQDISGISSDDIVSVEIVKDPQVLRIFRPRVGGIVLITTKSKKFLTPILSEYEKMSEEAKRNRVPGQLLIR